MKKNLLRIALLFLTFTLSLNTFAADKDDVYTEGLKIMMKVGGLNIIDVDQLSKMSDPMGTGAEQFANNMVDILAPYYRENMSEEDFKQMVAFYQKPEIVAVAKKVVETSSASKDEIMQNVMPDMAKVMQGGELDPIKVEGCSEEFIKAFERFYNVTYADKSMEGAFSFMQEMITGMMPEMPEGETAKIKPALEKMFSYIKVNIKPLVMMILSKSITADDLNTMSSIDKEPFYPAMQKVNDAVVADLPAIMKKIMGSIQFPGM